ncbi:unnamed protein product [Moneuplotes crassus]|uniref:Uncharacterized protein n=1 Tax=Euplotes crassus TaxID=5936 RepID=A0AAD2D2J1_EUPCR|nr:unnamed protein product [Moneuplotes crassus]
MMVIGSASKRTSQLYSQSSQTFLIVLSDCLMLEQLKYSKRLIIASYMASNLSFSFELYPPLACILNTRVCIRYIRSCSTEAKSLDSNLHCLKPTVVHS